MRKCMMATAILCMLASVAHAASNDALLEEAREQFKARQMQAAETLCTQYLDSHPAPADEAKARMLVGYIHLKADALPDRAVKDFQGVATRFPDTAEAREALLRVGYLRDKEGEKPAEWEQLASRYPKSKEASEALHGLGHVALRGNDPLLAVQRFDAGSAVQEALPEMAEDSQVEAGYACISAYWKTSDRAHLTQAAARFDSVKAHSGNPSGLIRARMGLGELYLIRNMGKEAAEEYKAVLGLSPADEYTRGVAEFELASAYYAACDWEAALKAYDVFLSNRKGASLPEKDAAWKIARPGYAKLSATDMVKAKKLSGLELVPAAAYFRASSLRHLGKQAEARALAAQVLDQFPQLGILERVQRLIAVCDIEMKEGK